MTEITADGDTILRQAHKTAHEYMIHSRYDIDAVFGDGYAEAHPDLVAAYMKTAAMDLGATIIAQQLRLGLREIATALTEGTADGIEQYSFNK